MSHCITPKQPNITYMWMNVTSQQMFWFLCIYDLENSPDSVFLSWWIQVPSNISVSSGVWGPIPCSIVPCTVIQPIQKECKTLQAPFWYFLQCRSISSYHQRWWPYIQIWQFLILLCAGEIDVELTVMEKKNKKDKKYFVCIWWWNHFISLLLKTSAIICS